MHKKKPEFKKSVRVCLVIEEEYFDHLQKVAIDLSNKEGRIVKQSEMMRIALKKAFPLPENNDLENAK